MFVRHPFDVWDKLRVLIRPVSEVSFELSQILNKFLDVPVAKTSLNSHIIWLTHICPKFREHFGITERSLITY